MRTTKEDVRNWLAFAALRAQYRVLCRVGNVCVGLHVRATSQIGTPNILGELVRENLELAIRRLEQKQHTVKKRYERIGERIIQ